MVINIYISWMYSESLATLILPLNVKYCATNTLLLRNVWCFVSSAEGFDKGTHEAGRVPEQSFAWWGRCRQHGGGEGLQPQVPGREWSDSGRLQPAAKAPHSEGELKRWEGTCHYSWPAVFGGKKEASITWTELSVSIPIHLNGSFGRNLHSWRTVCYVCKEDSYLNLFIVLLFSSNLRNRINWTLTSLNSMKTF